MSQLKRPGSSVYRKNITLPTNFEERIAQLRAQLGSASDSEVIRYAITKLEEHVAAQRSKAAARQREQAK